MVSVTDRLSQRYGEQVIVDRVSLCIGQIALWVVRAGSRSGTNPIGQRIRRLMDADTGAIRWVGEHISPSSGLLLPRRSGDAFASVLAPAVRRDTGLSRCAVAVLGSTVAIDVQRTEPAVTYKARMGGQVGVIGAFATDGRIAARDRAVPNDRKGVLPAYDAVFWPA